MNLLRLLPGYIKFQSFCSVFHFIFYGASREPLDSEGQLEDFTEFGNQVLHSMGRNVEIFTVCVNPKVHGRFAGSAYNAGNALFMTFVESFCQGQEKRKHTDLLHL